MQTELRFVDENRVGLEDARLKKKSCETDEPKRAI